MSIKAFLESEKKLALFDNYVVDMGGYYWEHPGTAYVLEECNKMDLGKYFFGSYTMENAISPVRHSFIAGKVLMRLIIARLVQPKENSLVFRKAEITEENEIASGNQNESQSAMNMKGEDHTPPMYESSMVFHVTSEVEHLKMVYHVGFGNQKTEVKMFFPGTEMLGRHYIICLLYTSPSPRDLSTSRMPSSA